MKRVFWCLLVSAGIMLLHTSCEKNELTPVAEPTFETDAAIAQMKAELDGEILDMIRSTGKPFDWSSASDDMILRAIIVTGYPLVVGYLNNGHDGRAVRNDILDFIYKSEGREAARLGREDDVLTYQDEKLGFFHVKVENPETIEGLRTMRGVRYMEPAGYPILLDEIAAHYASLRHAQTTAPPVQRSMVLDPYQVDPDYYSQVQSYSGSAATCFRRHNVDDVYRTYDIYGEGVGVAVFDNGVLPEYQDFILSNGYGRREFRGYYNPLWFLPWTEPDGATPQSPDLLFLSQIIEGQWLHGWQQNEDVLIGSPNAVQYSVRASPVVLLMVPAQNIGVINSLVAMAEDPDIRIVSMAMGSLFRVRPMEDAIDYLHSQDKILVSAAGTSLFFTRQIIGVVFPASYEPVVAVTGIENREETDGNFVLGENAHGGPEVDFCIERNQSSSGATSRFSGMLGLVWGANPDLNREEVIDILIQSSNFYQELGQKYARFGWGTPDIFQAVGLAMD